MPLPTERLTKRFLSFHLVATVGPAFSQELRCDQEKLELEERLRAEFGLLAGK